MKVYDKLMFAFLLIVSARLGGCGTCDILWPIEQRVKDY